MVIKQIIKKVTVLAFLFAAVVASPARKKVQLDAVLNSPAVEVELPGLDENGDDAAPVTLEDQELLNKGSLKDLKLQEELNLALSTQEDPSTLNDELALNDEIFNPEDMTKFFESEEGQEMVAQTQKFMEDLEKNSPEEYKQMMAEAEKMMQAFQSGEGFDFDSDFDGLNEGVPAGAAA